MTNKELEKAFGKLKNDVDKWKFIIKHKDRFEIKLDNDATHVNLIGDDEYEFNFELNDYLGWSDGVFTLLEAIGLEAEGV